MAHLVGSVYEGLDSRAVDVHAKVVLAVQPLLVGNNASRQQLNVRLLRQLLTELLFHLCALTPPSAHMRHCVSSPLSSQGRSAGPHRCDALLLDPSLLGLALLVCLLGGQLLGLFALDLLLGP